MLNIQDATGNSNTTEIKGRKNDPIIPQTEKKQTERAPNSLLSLPPFLKYENRNNGSFIKQILSADIRRLIPDSQGSYADNCPYLTLNKLSLNLVKLPRFLFALTSVGASVCIASPFSRFFAFSWK